MLQIEKLKLLAAGNVWFRHPVVTASLSEERRFEPTEIRRLLRAMGRQREDARDFPGWTVLTDSDAPLATETALAILARLLKRTIYHIAR